MTTSIRVATGGRSDFLDISREVAEAVRKAGKEAEICTVFVPHTTCGITINENADPDVRTDIIRDLERLVPWKGPYLHGEGNSAAHIRASMMGFSVSIPCSDGRLMLGTWQGIYLCEFDGPRMRTVIISVR